MSNDCSSKQQSVGSSPNIHAIKIKFGCAHESEQSAKWVDTAKIGQIVEKWIKIKTLHVNKTMHRKWRKKRRQEFDNTQIMLTATTNVAETPAYSCLSGIKNWVSECITRVTLSRKQHVQSTLVEFYQKCWNIRIVFTG